MNFQNRKVVNNPIRSFIALSNGVYDGEFFYGRSPEEGLIALDPLKDERKVISDEEVFRTGGAQILAVNKYGVYFTSMNEEPLSKSVIYRFSFDGTIEEVCDFRDGVIQEINFVEDGAVVLYPSIYFKNESGERVEDSAANGAYVHYELDENGKFINPKPIGERASNEKLVEFFKEFNASHGDPEVVTTEESTTATVATTETASTTETAETTETAATTATAATELTTEETATTEETTVGTTASTIDVATLPIVGKYTNLHEQIEFKGVAPLPVIYKDDSPGLDIYSDVDCSYIYSGNFAILGTKINPSSFYIATIAGYNEEKSNNSPYAGNQCYYYAYVEKYGEGLTDDTLYDMVIYGTAENPIYGQDRFEIGQRFLITSYYLNKESRFINGTRYRWICPA
ncbi:MAG: hypothetical protein J5793_05295 [Clostridia bacterium]|nr:hypothetical protein [Clostridia bacterium]